MATTNTPPRTVYARQGDTLDALLHRHLGATAGHTEATLAANAGIADAGAVLPMGTPVRLVAAPPPPRNTVHLWD